MVSEVDVVSETRRTRRRRVVMSAPARRRRPNAALSFRTTTTTTTLLLLLVQLCRPTLAHETKITATTSLSLYNQTHSTTTAMDQVVKVNGSASSLGEQRIRRFRFLEDTLPGTPTEAPIATPNPTPEPTPNPTPEPTPEPTPAPTPNPTPNPTTPAPTPQPTPQPTTKAPTTSPTASPSKAPSRQPTPSPTPEPTPSPTSSPSSSPSNRPTPFPTPGPTPFPTSAPSSSPSSLPSATPSQRPTPAPTGVPSAIPSQVPSTLPSSGPTGVPSFVPSANPTPSGTLEPTDFPSDVPSATPSVSQQPSHAPSNVPSSEPTTSAPTTTPSAGPTNVPSAAPSESPTLSLQSELVEAVMSMDPWLSEDLLAGNSIIVWESVTSQHILQHLRNNAGIDPPLIDLQVGTNIVSQGFPSSSNNSNNNNDGGGNGDSSSRLLLRRTLRQLQDTMGSNEERSLIIQFDVAVSFRSETDDYDIPSFVYGAFDEESDRERFIRSLQSRSSTFDDIDDVLVQVRGFEPPPPKESKEEEGIGLPVIIGAAVGGAALIFLIAFIIFRRRHSQKRSQTSQRSSQPQSKNVATEILVEPQDDISTLGDPMFGPGGMLMNGQDKDDITASVGDDYSYAKQYRKSQYANGMARDRMLSEDYTKGSSANSSALGHLNSIVSDDASFEQQFFAQEERFDVVAPAGKLGMVIDTPQGGSPVVHAIKQESVLYDQVRVGDRLISVDGEDCRTMTAMQVSKLISLKAEKPARVLVFVRSSGGTTN